MEHDYLGNHPLNYFVVSLEECPLCILNEYYDFQQCSYHLTATGEVIHTCRICDHTWISKQTRKPLENNQLEEKNKVDING
jgi:hypothetical protein